MNPGHRFTQKNVYNRILSGKMCDIMVFFSMVGNYLTI